MFLRELGRGEHSQVYLARTPRRLGLAADTVAVKVLSLTGTDGFDALADELGLVRRAPLTRSWSRCTTSGWTAGRCSTRCATSPWGRCPHRRGT